MSGVKSGVEVAGCGGGVDEGSEVVGAPGDLAMRMRRVQGFVGEEAAGVEDVGRGVVVKEGKRSGRAEALFARGMTREAAEW